MVKMLTFTLCVILRFIFNKYGNIVQPTISAKEMLFMEG